MRLGESMCFFAINNTEGDKAALHNSSGILQGISQY